MSTQLPKRHHYAPEFYLRAWADKDGMLHRYAFENGRVRLRRRAPKSVGYQEKMYRAPHEHLTEEQAVALETHFFGPIDSQAAKALKRLLAGDLELSKWTEGKRQGWVMFVRSLRLRSPSGVTEARGHLRSIFENTLRALEPEYGHRRSDSDPLTFDAFCSRLHPEHPERSVLPAIAHAISSETVGLRIMNAQWAIVDVAKAAHTLLVSDVKPSHIGLDLPNGHIMLPISPTKLFVAVTDRQFLDALRNAPETGLVRVINQRTVGEAKQFVVACNDSQTRYIQNWFGTDLKR